METDVLGIDRDALSPEALEGITAAHPRPDFKRWILRGFNDGSRHRPHSAFGNVDADVLEYFDPAFVRDDFVAIIATTAGPSEMHSDSTYLSSSKRKLPAGNNPEPRPPAHRVSESVDYLSLLLLQR